MPQEWFVPAASCFQLLAAPTCTGALWFVVCPLPRRPLPPLPKHTAALSMRRAHVWYGPAVIAA